MDTFLSHIPGFVDLQVNGHLGVDFSSPELTEDRFTHACQALLNSGTAVFLPTIITSSLETYQRNLPLMAKGMMRSEFRGCLPGIHLEGPFISAQPGAVGAHNAAWTRTPDVNLLRQLHDWSGGLIRLLTLAAELDGAAELARAAVELGMVVSIGHTLASSDDLDRLHQAGAAALTHLGNGLPPTLPKLANPLWAGLADDHYTAMMIGDGHHIPVGVLKAMIRAKRIEKTIIVSDAAPVAGLPPGEYDTLGNRAILESSGRLYNPDRGSLVGSSYTLLRCMNYLASSGLSQEDCLALGFYNPLKLINLTPQSLPASHDGLHWRSQDKQFVCES